MVKVFRNWHILLCAVFLSASPQSVEEGFSTLKTDVVAVSSPKEKYSFTQSNISIPYSHFSNPPEQTTPLIAVKVQGIATILPQKVRYSLPLIFPEVTVKKRAPSLSKMPTFTETFSQKFSPTLFKRSLKVASSKQKTIFYAVDTKMEQTVKSKALTKAASSQYEPAKWTPRKTFLFTHIHQTKVKVRSFQRSLKKERALALGISTFTASTPKLEMLHPFTKHHAAFPFQTPKLVSAQKPVLRTSFPRAFTIPIEHISSTPTASLLEKKATYLQKSLLVSQKMLPHLTRHIFSLPKTYTGKHLSCTCLQFPCKPPVVTLLEDPRYTALSPQSNPVVPFINSFSYLYFFPTIHNEPALHHHHTALGPNALDLHTLSQATPKFALKRMFESLAVTINSSPHAVSYCCPIKLRNPSTLKFDTFFHHFTPAMSPKLAELRGSSEIFLSALQDERHDLQAVSTSLIASKQTISYQPSLSLKKERVLKIAFVEDRPLTRKLHTPVQFSTFYLPKEKLSENISIEPGGVQSSITKVRDVLSPNSPFVYPLLYSEDRLKKINQGYRLTSYNLSRIPSTRDLAVKNYEHLLETSVELLPRNDGPGYFFAVTLKPTKNATLERQPQNVLFLIDRTSSILQPRFEAYKNGVLSALRYLNENDTFNIVLVDSKLQLFQNEPVSVSRSSIRRARAFLSEAMFSKNAFSSTQLFDLLYEMQDYFPKNGNHNTAVLMSDGLSLMSLDQKAATLNLLLTKNQGHFTLHTAAAGNGKNNIAMLDLLSAFHGGEFVFSHSLASFPRKLARLIKKTNTLYADTMSVTPAIDSPTTELELFQSNARMPSFFASVPFTIYGSTNSLEDIRLTFQGKIGDDYMLFTKDISFSKATKASPELFRFIAINKAYLCYDLFLKKMDPEYLKQASTLLAKYKLPKATAEKPRRNSHLMKDRLGPF